MDNKTMNTTIDFEFCDGSKAKLTLTFYALYKLRSDNKAVYDRYNRIMNNLSKGQGDELDSVFILYTAYLCANSKDEKLMSEEEFIIKCGSDRRAVANAARELTQPKKQ